MKITEITVVVLSASLLSSCANTQDQLNETGAHYGTEILCGVGAIGGAIVGNLVGRKLGNAAAGTAIGAALGTGGGCYAGNIWQTRSKALLEAARKANIRMTTESALTRPSATDKQAGGIVAQVSDQGMFDTGSAQLTTTGHRQIDSLARVYAEAQSTPRYYLVVGHTDSTGNPEVNKQLSEQRAKSVGSLLRGAGIPASHIYYQGAGASRPIGSNQTPEGRAKNRRVEISELSDEKALAMRIEQEQGNSRYLDYSSTVSVVRASSAAAEKKNLSRATTLTPSAADKAVPESHSQITENKKQTRTGNKNKTSVATTTAETTRHIPASEQIDFNGQPAASVTSVVTGVDASESSSWFPTARAADTAIMSCATDSLRISGQVKSLATGKDFTTHHSYDYLPGYGGLSWANVVNNNLVVISPVAILRDGAQPGQNPTISIVTHFTGTRKEPSAVIPAIAQTYQGKDDIIYRVYPRQTGSAVTCMDIVFSTRGAKATKGQLFYPKATTTYVADYIPTH
ncbi:MULTISPECIES: OmpA family protein [unclassified Tatumella]|uniref:OmpA family protein n=1 Tax=unclassified Tatumella TaxID=2649542 RepID=UPI001BAE69CE|nr:MULTISPECIES: OmpA family protein [unclassified Tatumella]MBS0877295.1 OmpA family protein [Tatumella sp. JGM82]MBS0890832.1 OmpA family protein [Tatumella sp. JGM94]MBS0901692.1 OmpA family protein [Tatumella sp. JGM100]